MRSYAPTSTGGDNARQYAMSAAIRALRARSQSRSDYVCACVCTRVCVCVCVCVRVCSCVSMYGGGVCCLARVACRVGRGRGPHAWPVASCGRRRACGNDRVAAEASLVGARERRHACARAHVWLCACGRWLLLWWWCVCVGGITSPRAMRSRASAIVWRACFLYIFFGGRTAVTVRVRRAAAPPRVVAAVVATTPATAPPRRRAMGGVQCGARCGARWRLAAAAAFYVPWPWRGAAARGRHRRRRRRSRVARPPPLRWTWTRYRCVMRACVRGPVAPSCV